MITDLTFSLYSTFVIEVRHGFNKQTMWLFFRDMIKGIALAAVIGPPIVSVIIVIVQKGGPYLAIYLWAFMLVFSLVMMTLYPILIEPIFNKFTPLPEGELRTKIEKLASSLQFPLKKLFVVDGSTRSSHSNGCSITSNIEQAIMNKHLVCFIKYHDKDIRGVAVRKYPVIKLYPYEQVFPPAITQPIQQPADLIRQETELDEGAVTLDVEPLEDQMFGRNCGLSCPKELTNKLNSRGKKMLGV